MKRRRAAAGPAFVQLHHWLMDSPAWGSLSPNARCVYFALKRLYDGRNNGLISFSARQAGSALGATHHTGNRALTELVDAGFVEIAEQSDFNRKMKMARTYVLTEVPDDRPGRSRIASKAFMRVTQNLKHSRTGAHDSRMGATVTAKSAAKTVEQSHPCDCEAPFGVGHSRTHATHIDSNHRHVVSDDCAGDGRPTIEEAV